jgi:tetratricopeptide (TPR) repeat protein
MRNRCSKQKERWEVVEEVDPYAVLGVAPDASSSQIKQRYREQVKYCHPDLGDEPGRLEAFKRLTEAYQLLLDPLARANHDMAAGRANTQGAGLAGGPSSATGATEGKGSSGGGGYLNADTAEVAAAQERDRHIEELLATGRRKLAIGAWREAEDAGRFVLRWDKKNADAYVLIAEAMAATNRVVEARGCLSLALQLAPNHSAARRALLILQNRQQHRTAGETGSAEELPCGHVQQRR